MRHEGEKRPTTDKAVDLDELAGEYQRKLDIWQRSYSDLLDEAQYRSADDPIDPSRISWAGMMAHQTAVRLYELEERIGHDPTTEE